MSAVTTPPERRTTQVWSDVVISSAVLIITTAALLATIGWPTAAALFPRIASIIGVVCSAGYLLTILVQRLRDRSVGQKIVSETEPDTKEDTEAPVNVEYVFATAGTKAWLRALGWISIFLILMYLLGVFIAGAFLALLYLRFGAGRGWLFATIYSASLTIFLWMLFDMFLQAPLPRGALGLF